MIFFMIDITCMVLMFVIALFLVKKIRSLKRENDKILKMAQDDVASSIVDKTILLSRVKELEDGIKDSFGISVRNEITKIVCAFDKLEMVIMMAGIYKLIETSGTIEDKEAYIKLYKKIQENAEKMEEEELND